MNNFDIERAESRFEGNYTNLMLERAGSPRISGQIVDLVFRANQYAKERIGTFIEVDSNSGKHIYERIEDGEKRQYEFTEERLASFNATEDEIAAELEARITSALQVTGVSFKDPQTGKYQNEEDEYGPWAIYSENEMCLPIGFDADLIKVEHSSGYGMSKTRLFDMIVAHEKGHLIRPYGIEYGSRYKFYKGHFSSGFDFTSAVFSDEALKNVKDPYEEEDIESIKTSIINYISSGSEIAERMAQLKNWLGFTGADIFTKHHLKLAQERYVIETGLDNYMEIFLSAVTPETEDDFIELINHSGI